MNIIENLYYEPSTRIKRLYEEPDDLNISLPNQGYSLSPYVNFFL